MQSFAKVQAILLQFSMEVSAVFLHFEFSLGHHDITLFLLNSRVILILVMKLILGAFTPQFCG